MIKRHPQAIALDKWLESTEGQSSLDVGILRENRLRVFLENRIKSAFAAGWKEAEAQRKRKCDCPIHCKFCGAKLRRDVVGHYCPTKNCQWSYQGTGCPCRPKGGEGNANT